MANERSAEQMAQETQQNLYRTGTLHKVSPEPPKENEAVGPEDVPATENTTKTTTRGNVKTTEPTKVWGSET